MDEYGYSLEVKLTDEEWERYLAHKRRWCRLQPLIETRGYRIAKQYNPDTVSAWKERPKGYVDEPNYPHLLEGVRISDKRPVMLKFTRTDLWEAQIFQDLASFPDADNHTIPLYDVITPPHDPDSQMQWCIVVTPRLTDCRERHFRTLEDLVQFITQVIEGVCFMHRYNIAHTDVARTNIVWDKRPIDDDPLDRKGKPKSRRPTVAPRRYYFIDFGLACAFPSFEERGRVQGLCGQHRNIPELSEEVPYDPFPLDIRQIGEMLTRDYTQVYAELEFLEPWIARLRDDDPTKRPTAPETLAYFQNLVASLPEEKLKAQVYGRNEWPNGRRFMTYAVIIWFFANAVFLWWNWKRLTTPIVLISDDLSG
ncbi:unnamed protein product [Mycena citricolor]|uniref:Protein kinase domain-containing protein n=1 Tax=Mycena citricolor TaxID=2018698 RepID=A0AAD2GSY1_9AGAR|nr:unnamed protein product [Mycena citricolor]